MSYTCQCFWNCYKTLTFCSLLARCRIPCPCHAKPYPNFQKWSETVGFSYFSLPNVLRATTACTFSTSQLPKGLRAWCALYILTSKSASRHGGVHFFDISTSKSDPRPRNVLRTTTACTFSTFSTSKSASNLVCFAHFDFKMCFAPQRRAIFHLSSPQTAPHPPL